MSLNRLNKITKASFTTIQYKVNKSCMEAVYVMHAVDIVPRVLNLDVYMSESAMGSGPLSATNNRLKRRK